MKTEIFKNYADFLNRKDKSVNGVDEAHAKRFSQPMGDAGNSGCWNCSDCTDCSRCYGCSDCTDCSGCTDCFRCSDCSGCWNCSDCFRCSDCSRCSRCSRCRKIPEGAKYACLIGLYKYVCSPRLHVNGEQWVQMGCMLRTRSDWEDDFWNNPVEFPNDGSEKSNARMVAFQIACGILDKWAKKG